jgi:serine/threonine protein kinase
MEYIKGKTVTERLAELKRENRYMPFAEIIQIMRQVADALDFAHRQNIIHRDIKPSNIMIEEGRDRVVLMDFGLVLQADTDNTMGTAFGTPRYISPEQALSSQQAVPQSDQYSLAIIVYEMLVGITPFDDDSAMSLALSHITNPPPNPQEIRPDLSDAVADVILRALEKSPDARYPSVTEFIETLAHAMALSPEPTQTRSEGSSVLKATVPDLPVVTPAMVKQYEEDPEAYIRTMAPMLTADNDDQWDSPPVPIQERAALPSQPPRRGSNRLMLMGGAALILLLVAGAVFMFVLGGGDDKKDDKTPVANITNTPGQPTLQLSLTVDNASLLNVTATISQLQTQNAALTNAVPTDAPTRRPTRATTQAPTDAPTDVPTQRPTRAATQAPTDAPTDVPTQRPTRAATQTPTDAPTEAITPSATPLPRQLWLNWSEDYLVISNRSEEIFDLRGLELVALDGTNRFTIRTNEFGVETLSLFGPKECLQIIIQGTTPNLIPFCNERTTTTVRYSGKRNNPIFYWVWLAPAGGGTGGFNVVYEGDIVRSCNLERAQCIVSMPQ